MVDERAWIPDDYDAEIGRLLQEKEELRKMLEDSEQRGQRAQRRGQIFGDWAIGRFTWSDEQVAALRDATGDKEQWLFDTQLLKLDGWTRDDKGWHAPQSG